MDAEQQQLAERAEKVSALWPTLTEALGCLDCGFLIRHAIGEVCPLCGSRGEMLNVAEFFNDARMKEQRLSQGGEQDTSL